MRFNFESFICDLTNYLRHGQGVTKPSSFSIIPEAQIWHLNHLLTLAHSMQCDIYFTGGSSNSRIIGIGHKQPGNRALEGNLFIRIEKSGSEPFLSIGSGSRESLNDKLSARSIIQSLLYLRHQKGSSKIPSDYISDDT